MSLASVIAQYPSGSPVFLAEITVGNQYTFFFNVTGNTWKTADTNVLTDFQVDGVSLTLETSLANVEANANSYYNDGTWTYFNTAVNIYDWQNHSVQAFYTIYCCNVIEGSGPRVFNGNLYQPRIMSLPSLSLKLEKKFSSIAEISGGSMGLNNEDGYFNQFSSMNFDAGQTQLKFGWDYKVNGNWVFMAYSDYQSKATFWNSGRTYDETTFTLGLLDLKSRLKVKIPLTFYDSVTYPNIEKQGVGKPIPLAYGQIFGAPAVCVDTVAKKFKVASHAIYSLDAVRILDSTTNLWNDSSFATTTLSDGTFTLGSDWTPTKSVSVDFKGRLNNDGSFMNNASDIMADLLTQVGQGSSLDSASFLASKNLLDLGFDSFAPATNNRLVYLKPSFYINESQNVTDIINAMNAFVGALLYVDANGNYHYVVFDPQRRTNLPSFDDTSLQGWDDETEEILNYTSVTSIHSLRLADAWGEEISYSIPPSKYLHKQPQNINAQPNVPTSDATDANLFVQRFMIFQGRPSRIFQGDIIRSDGFLLNPGDQIHVYYNKSTKTGVNFIDQVLDIIQITYNLEGGDNKTATVTVYCSNLRGWADQPGWWGEDNQTLPPSFSQLAGYGDGTMNTWNRNWDPIIKAYARQASGWCTDDNGYADPVDPASWIPSVWI